MDNIDPENVWPIMEVVDGLLNGVLFMNAEEREKYHNAQEYNKALWRAERLCGIRKEELEIASDRLIVAMCKNHKRRGGRFPYYLIGKMNIVVNAQKAYDQAQEEYSKIYYAKH